MFSYFQQLNPITQSLITGIICFFSTLLGSSIVFIFRSVKKSIMELMMFFSLGIMLSAAFFSLLNPAIEIIDNQNFNVWTNIILGFSLGSLLLFFGNILINYFSSKSKYQFSKLKNDIMLFFSITLHNIPEGLVIGVAFGSLKYSENVNASLIGALILTLGIAIQNFFEGSAISLPLKRSGLSTKDAFLYGMLSGIVEPVSALVGVILVLKISILLPFVMSFAASAMIYVTVMEIISSSDSKENDLLVLFFIIGFSIMMLLELIL